MKQKQGISEKKVGAFVDRQCTQHFPRWLGACANYCVNKLLHTKTTLGCELRLEPIKCDDLNVREVGLTRTRKVDLVSIPERSPIRPGRGGAISREPRVPTCSFFFFLEFDTLKASF
jgi:hypothetical protein